MLLVTMPWHQYRKDGNVARQGCVIKMGRQRECISDQRLQPQDTTRITELKAGTNASPEL